MNPASHSCRSTTSIRCMLRAAGSQKGTGTFFMAFLEVTSDDIIVAEGLILKRYMKPVDSIQLAIALNLRRDDVTFVSSDRRLCKLAAEEGLHILTH